MRNDSKNKDLLKITNDQRRKYKKLISHKKSAYLTNSLDKLSNISKQSPKKFWNSVNRLRSGSKNEATFSNDNITSYFNNLLNPNIVPRLPNKKFILVESLDKAIEGTEISRVLKKSKKGKSAGLDQLSREMIYCLFEAQPLVLIKLFNDILNTGIFPQCWRVALIVLIHKKGHITDLDNYRGISLLSVLSKIFSAIMNNRIMEWAVNNNKFSPSQLGFMKGIRTSDALNLVHNIIDDYCYKKNAKLFACFVDFRKAFDNVPRGILLEKLWNLGITGKMFNIIKSMYSDDSVRIKMGEYMSTSVSVSKGVKQGCVLSPTLFNLFISDFPDLLSKPSGNTVFIDDNERIPCIMWADDIVIFSQSAAGLQEQINRLHEFSINNKLPVNTSKTKCMCCCKSGKIIRNNFSYGQESLEDVKEYVYLGFLVQCNGKVDKGLKNLSERAWKAFYRIRSPLGSSLYSNKCVFNKLYDSIIKPILLYGCDFWGLYKICTEGKAPCDNFNAKIWKYFLGVGKNTSSIGTLYEVGCYPCSIDAQIRAFNNWVRVTDSNSTCKILLISSRFSIKNSGKFYENFLKFLEKQDMVFLTENTANIKPKGKISKILKKSLIEQFSTNCNRALIAATSKIKLLKKVKPNFQEASYINTLPRKKRKFYAKLRLSDHELEVEKGRYKGLKRINRVCNLCVQETEDEAHFLLRCPFLAKEREMLFNQIRTNLPLFLTFSDEQKVALLMNSYSDTKSSNLLIDMWDMREVKLQYRACSDLLFSLCAHAP